MSVSRILRIAAIAMAAVGVLDPPISIEREQPAGVVVRSAASIPAADDLARRVRERLTALVGDRVDFEPEKPVAMVLTGLPADAADLPDDIPISFVHAVTPAPNLQIASVSSPAVAIPGLAFPISAIVNASGAAGRTTAIVLEQEGVEIDRVEHAWTSDSEVVDVRFDHVPSDPGSRVLRVRAMPLDEEAEVRDNHADVRLLVQERRLRVFVYEPRPSWTATFIRRVLEDEPLFEVASLVRPSRGLAVRTDGVPERLQLQTLEPFDVVIVGAPEDLTPNQVSVLREFASRRGGTVVLASDRRPTGPCVSLLPVTSFQERLLEEAVLLVAQAGALRASEMIVPIEPPPSVEPIAAFEGEGELRSPVVFAWPIGLGRGVFSGALDAWRHRARDEAFATFWRAQTVAAALASPPAVEVTLEPGVAAPGESVKLTVRVRPTEFERGAAGVTVPTASAGLVAADGRPTPIRLWPEAETGRFSGEVEAPQPGTYLVSAAIPGASFETALVVKEDARVPQPGAWASARLLAEATGGTVVTEDGLSPLAEYLERLPRARASERVFPARSPWWMAGFVALVCAEWSIRRRRGLS